MENHFFNCDKSSNFAAAKKKKLRFFYFALIFLNFHKINFKKILNAYYQSVSS